MWMVFLADAHAEIVDKLPPIEVFDGAMLRYWGVGAGLIALAALFPRVGSVVCLVCGVGVLWFSWDSLFGDFGGLVQAEMGVAYYRASMRATLTIPVMAGVGVLVGVGRVVFGVVRE